jgi:hypothetical protein
LITLLGLVIVLVAAVFIALPLTRPELAEPDDPAAELLERRAAIYRAIADLDLEFGERRISPDDYARQRDEYLEEAASILRQLDEATNPLPSNADRTDAIERELRELRERRAGSR